MATSAFGPLSLEESLIYRAIVLTLAFWLVGAVYIVGSLIGWLLVCIWIARSVGWLPAVRQTYAIVPLGVLLWISGMGGLAVALVIGHVDFDLGFEVTFKSFIGWMKGWALFAILPLAGASLAIRPAVIYRASNVLGLQLLILAPLLLLAAVVGLPPRPYVSPFEAIAGNARDFFEVALYNLDPESNQWRWQFYAPWAPAAAFIGCMSFVMALHEKNLRWRWIGIVSAVVVCYMTRSRMGFIAIPALLIAIFLLKNVANWRLYSALAAVVVLGLLVIDPLLEMLSDARNAFDAARASSSRVRATLQTIALHRWWSEAIWFGHGVVERGPHLVEFMPIGSHHTWNGLLFVKGVLGFVALAVPMGWTAIEFALKAMTDRVARAALSVVLMLFLFSFGENLESLAYMCWPALLLIGVAHRRRLVLPTGAWLQRIAHRQEIGLATAPA